MTEAQKKARTKAAWSAEARAKRNKTWAKKRQAKKSPLRPEFEPFVINRKHLKPVETSRRASDEPRQFWIDQIEELREERRRFEHNFYDAIMWMVRK